MNPSSDVSACAGSCPRPTPAPWYAGFMAQPPNEATPPTEPEDESPSVLVEVAEYAIFLARLEAAAQTPLSAELKAAAERFGLELRSKGLLG